MGGRGKRTTTVGGHASCAHGVVFREAALLDEMLGEAIAGCEEDLGGTLVHYHALDTRLGVVSPEDRASSAVPIFWVASRWIYRSAQGIREGMRRHTAVVILCVNRGAVLSFD